LWIIHSSRGGEAGAKEVRLNPELEAKLVRIAAESGHGAETPIEEAVERFVDYDEWFSRQEEEGLNAGARTEHRVPYLPACISADHEPQ
jgi:predicted transcriptional regulator